GAAAFVVLRRALGRDATAVPLEGQPDRPGNPNPGSATGRMSPTLTRRRRRALRSTSRPAKHVEGGRPYEAEAGTRQISALSSTVRPMRAFLGQRQRFRPAAPPISFGVFLVLALCWGPVMAEALSLRFIH